MWIALVPLLVALDGASTWKAWWIGIAAGFVWRIGTLYWVAHVMFNYGGMSTPVSYAVAALLALWMALNTGLFCMLVPVALRWGSGGAVALAAVWVALEYVQTLLPFGFPWALVGYAAGASPALMQSADLAGVWGLGFLTIFVNAAIALRILDPRRALPAVSTAAVLLVAATLYGGWRLSDAPPLGGDAGATVGTEADASLRVAVVQGNVEQGRIWDPAALNTIIREHISLSIEAIGAGAELVMWAESSVPVRGGLEGDPSMRDFLSRFSRERGVPLVVGSPHFGTDGAGRPAVTNAAFLVTGAGEWSMRYDKVHLVPWGEYVPVSWLFRFVAPLVDAPVGFRRGDHDQRPFADPAAGVPPFAMAICYEVVFPNHVRRQVAAGATFVATITNDAWFGATSAPYQHFAMARFRAVENRRFLVRAANTGISGMVDPWGRVLASTELDERAFAIATIEPRYDNSPYVLWGDAFARLCVLLGLVAALLAWRGEPTSGELVLPGPAVPTRQDAHSPGSGTDDR